MILNSHSNGQQPTLENITTSESQSQLMRQVEKPGLTLTDRSRLGDIAEYIVIIEALRRGADVFKNVGCTGKTDIILAKDEKTLHVDVKTEHWDKRCCRYVSYGVRGAKKSRALVNPQTWAVRWPKGKEPEGWETFWN